MTIRNYFKNLPQPLFFKEGRPMLVFIIARWNMRKRISYQQYTESAKPFDIAQDITRTRSPGYKIRVIRVQSVYLCRLCLDFNYNWKYHRTSLRLVIQKLPYFVAQVFFDICLVNRGMSLGGCLMHYFFDILAYLIKQFF